MILPKKDYFRLNEAADAWGCSVEDIIHWHGQGTVKLGVPVRNAGLVGWDASGRVLGFYCVSGIVFIPRGYAAEWQLGGADPAEVEAVYPDPDCPATVQALPRPRFHDLKPSDDPANWTG